LLIAVFASAPAAFADATAEYGEVTRFGGFDSSAFNGESYGGPTTPGRFLDPTGFAVDPEDNTVYVVDRTSKYAHNPTSWRIQQLSPTGDVLATTTFTLPNSNFAASAITGLAVDHRAGRLYALVIGSPPASAPISSRPVAQELLAWSTTANDARELHAAPGLPEDPLHTTGGLISNAEDLTSGPTLLYSPQGIAIDRTEAPGFVDDPVVIEATDYLPESAAGVPILGNPVPGDAIVQQVATSGDDIGHLLGRWSGASLVNELHASWGPAGISANPDGSLTVLLDSQRLFATDAYVVKLSADLTESKVLNGDGTEPPANDFDQAPLWIDDSPFAPLSGVGVSDPSGAGSEIVQLSTRESNSGNGPYAADIFSQQATEIGLHVDQQFSPTGPGPEYWVSGGYESHYESNIGVRLLRASTGGVVSAPDGSTIVNTLGNVKPGGPCNIAAPEAALAAGANGSLWVLDRGPRADAPNAAGAGREIIELASGAGRLCPQPSGTFTMTANGGASQPGGGTLTVPAGSQVTFDATSIKREGGKPFAYEWDVDGDLTNGPLHDGFETIRQMQAPEYYWPDSSLTYLYTQPGRYTVRARMRSDYGVYTTSPGTVVVTSPARPTAEFTATAAADGRQVIFNAAGSAAGVGTIANYHWNWGDGSSEDEGPDAPIVTHAYAQPGAYIVTLKVTNSSFQSATSVPQTVTVLEPPVSIPAPVLTGPLYGVSPVSYPIPAPPAGGVPTRLYPHVRFSGEALGVGLSCPATKALCAGTVRIETSGAFAAGSHAVRKPGGSRHGTRKLLLGEARFNLHGGQHKTVLLRLSAKGKALLRQRGHLSVLVIVSAHDPSGNPGTTTMHLTLKVANVRRARSHRGS